MTDPRPKVAVVVFPGSNDVEDAAWAMSALGGDSELVWHGSERLPTDTGAVVLPGGFSYGDYLRCGAMARFSPVVRAITAFAADGGLVLGICNGFQILCEAGLLPGVLQPNASLSFICRDVADRSVRIRARAVPEYDLIVAFQVGQQFLVGEPAPVAVLHGDRQRLGRCAARRERCRLALDDQRHVPAHERQRRVRPQRSRQQPCLGQDLEAVADPEHEAAAVGERGDLAHDR